MSRDLYHSSKCVAYVLICIVFMPQPGRSFSTGYCCSVTELVLVKNALTETLPKNTSPNSNRTQSRKDLNVRVNEGVGCILFPNIYIS